MRRPGLLSITVVAAVLTSACSAFAASYGEQEDVDDATTLWKMMEKAQLVGKEAVLSKPYKGASPHGYFLDTLETRMILGGHTGRLIITRNYGGEGVTRSMVANMPLEQLKSVTVMYQRQAGYDKPNQDWFWSKYSPAGEVLEDAQGIPIAGRVAKGERGTGCIACHRAAPGGDFVFSNDRGMGVAAPP